MLPFYDEREMWGQVTTNSFIRFMLICPLSTKTHLFKLSSLQFITGYYYFKIIKCLNFTNI